MARIVLADDGIEFDGLTPETRPLGGAESAVVSLLEALAARGHEVIARTNCRAPVTHKGVAWAPITNAFPDTADLYIANRGHKLIQRMPQARRQVFWTHNPAGYMVKWRYLWRFWQVKPAIVFIGEYHATTYPAWAPGGRRVVIPYGVGEAFREAEVDDALPTPRAIFTSNPLRSLDWLLAVWGERIQPRVPEAELHLFCGAATYGTAGDRKAQAMAEVLGRAREMHSQGVRLRDPIPKPALIDELRASRCMLYRGDLNETYCQSVAEAQALGVPAVLTDLGSMRERIVDGETGFIAENEHAFADRAVALLSDADLWRRQHAAALETQRAWRWADAAAAFEALLD